MHFWIKGLIILDGDRSLGEMTCVSPLLQEARSKKHDDKPEDNQQQKSGNAGVRGKATALLAEAHKQ